MTLRVALICPYSLSIPGGVQSQVLGLARQLRHDGLEVRVLGPCDGPPPESYVTPLGDSLPTTANGSIAPLAPDPAAAFRTIRVLNDEQFDVLHVHEPLVPGPALTAVTIRPVPIVGTFHAAGRSSSYRSMAPLLKRLAGHIDHRVAVSKDALNLVQGHLGGDYEVLFNGVDVASIQRAEPMVTTSRSIFFLGRHEERKGLDVLLASVQRLDQRRFDDVVVWIAGDGPDTARLKHEYARDDRLRWLGRLSEDEKLARLRSASVFCAPSLHGESFGVVLIEAMAAATPVVASALAGYRNVATHGIDALLVEPGDVDALAGALELALSDPAVTARLVSAGTVRADDFAMTRLASRYSEIYQQLAAEHPPRRRRRIWFI